MHTSNKLISGLWICPEGQSSLSNVELMCIHSFIANGHNFRLYVYGEIDNIPDIAGVEVADANDILSATKIFRSHDSFAHFADWFRWELMVKKGGWYVDMDMICLKPFDFADEIVLARENDNKITNSVLKFPPKHFVAKLMAKRCKDPLAIMPWGGSRKRLILKKIIRYFAYNKKKDRLKMEWGVAGGPLAITRVLRHFDLQHYAKPIKTFMPIHYGELHCFIDDSMHKNGRLKDMLDNSYAVHFFNQGWKWKNVGDKNDNYAEHSVIEVLKRRYLLD